MRNQNISSKSNNRISPYSGERRIRCIRHAVLAAVITVFCFSVTACGIPAEAETGAAVLTAAEESSEAETAEQDPADLQKITFTVPEKFSVLADQTLCDAEAKRRGYAYITKNSNGSTTYCMTVGQHRRMMKELKARLIDEIDALPGSASYPDFDRIETNDSTFTSFTVYTKSDKVPISDSMVLVVLYRYGKMYSYFNAQEPQTIHVDFVNFYSGEMIRNADSDNSSE